MPKPEKKTMALVDACRSPIRRKIMILVEEAWSNEEESTAKGIADRLDLNLSRISYHVTELFKAGALEVMGGEQKRGAWQKSYAPSEAFRATMTDTVVLDQIAELIDSEDSSVLEKSKTLRKLVPLIRATGRPVEA